jgi:hypothetical protein
VGVDANDARGPAAVCVLPRGTEEGTTVRLAREFSVVANQPAAFTLYSSTVRSEPADTLVTLDDSYDAQRHAPLVTAFRYGKRTRRVPLAIGLTAIFTEVGTLELWCESRTSDHRWRLAFNLRGLDADPLAAEGGGEEPGGVVVADEAIERAVAQLDAVFTVSSTASPEVLVGDLESTLGHAKIAWPLATIRRLADRLLEREAGRRKSAAHEFRWLNLTGFCARPGFGAALDGWRVSELRKVYAAGLAFPREIQNQVEWLVLWQRVGGGFTAGQQRELALRVAGQLGLGGRKGPRLNPQIERESWRLLASLERLDAGYRTRLGDELLERIRRDPRNASWLWAIGRLGARSPLYGPLNSVVPPAVAERWIDALVQMPKGLSPDVAAAIARIGGRTGDEARDIREDVSRQVAEALQASGFSGEAARLTSAVAVDEAEAGRVFGEALPEGLRIA